MNLLCPNCQKMLQVPEQYAGQLMKCPLCAGNFTVPALPQASAPPPPPPMMPAPAENFNAPPNQSAAGPTDHASPLPPPTGYTHQRSYTFSPRVLPWVAPLAMLIVFILLFLPWVGMFPAGVAVETQNGWNVAFGGMQPPDRVWDKYYGKSEMEYLNTPGIGAGVMLVFFVLLLLPGLVVALGSTLIHRKLIPVELPPSVTTYWSYRPLLVALLALGATVFLILQAASGFPLENETRKEVEKIYNAKKDPGQRPSDEDDLKQKMDEGREIGKYNLHTTTWFKLAVVFMVLAVIGALLDYWVERRGPMQPPPRVDVLT